jgi:hypothetical protein
MFRIAAIVVSTLSVCGCASTAGAFFNRPVVEDSVKGLLSTVSLAADRRTVVIVTEGPNQSKFCAEPPPDTATGLKTELDARLDAKSKKVEAELGLGLKDKLETTVVVVAERTAPLDAFRTGVYALCQYHLNGAIGRDDVRPLFEKLIDAFSAAERAKPVEPAK